MKKYNLLVPLAGRGQRFVDEGFVVPKYMITAHDKHLIDWALSSIDTSECNLIFCFVKVMIFYIGSYKTVGST